MLSGYIKASFCDSRLLFKDWYTRIYFLLKIYDFLPIIKNLVKFCGGGLIFFFYNENSCFTLTIRFAIFVLDNLEFAVFIARFMLGIKEEAATLIVMYF